jgi:hypothetical protein
MEKINVDLSKLAETDKERTPESRNTSGLYIDSESEFSGLKRPSSSVSCSGCFDATGHSPPADANIAIEVEGYGKH